LIQIVVFYGKIKYSVEYWTEVGFPGPRMAYFFADKIDVLNSPVGEFETLFLRGLTHKLNNLLAVFQGFSSLLQMSDNLDESGKESVGHMKAAAVSGTALTEKIMASGGCARLSFQRMVLGDYLPMIDRALREPSTKYGVPFELRADEGLPAIDVDSGRFKEILVELIRNAAEHVKYSGQPGETSLEIYAPGRSPEGTQGRVDFFVHNTGVIRDDRMKDIYKPFVSTKDGSHFGIGLTLASMLASQMNMTLGAKCENGRTTLWLSVPVAA
jgi:signal transduction histidine kinase